MNTVSSQTISSQFSYLLDDSNLKNCNNIKLYDALKGAKAQDFYKILSLYKRQYDFEVVESLQLYAKNILEELKYSGDVKISTRQFKLINYLIEKSFEVTQNTNHLHFLKRVNNTYKYEGIENKLIFKLISYVVFINLEPTGNSEDLLNKELKGLFTFNPKLREFVIEQYKKKQPS